MISPVTKMAPVLVSPSGPTPSGHLPLSCLDRVPVMRYFVEMFHVYNHGHEPAEAVRSALAKALVPYYPVAGRISNSDDGKLQVSCTGEGVWFVAASAACSLKDVEYMESEPFGISKEQLLPLPPPGVAQDDLIFLLQITEFECGGFVIGYIANHVFFDAIGVGQFIVAIGEMAKGLETPTTKPVWCREAIPNTFPLGIELTHSTAAAPPPPSRLEHHKMDLPLDGVNLLTNQYTKETGRRCSSFDVLAAMLWQCRTRAIDLPPHADVSLDFPTNVRQKLREELPAEGGYYGNCICEVVIEQTGAYIANASLLEVITLIKDAKENLSTKFSRWLKGEPHVDKSPQQLVAYGSLCLTDLRRVGFYEADYGWGAPDHVVPLFDYPIALCTILNSPPPMKGVRVLTQCVAKEHLQAFCDKMNKLASLY
ncbi:putative 3'-N-debenzoyl-2'-deoxytaxol N-benzoyltransferase [Iris pallida]|uniref:3'-N-debenzoyl-2'-deoxytaxol N-benzoyltransferase n=1 Tax=Iris pallida TaxID=29817 RepID=A0AAX6HWW2_IRIPA|nr:putative 3'-N-debenzoyl-2'-deoxytaxol N-benzoyltransferase [Iris pallida]